MKIRPMEVELYADGRTVRQTDRKIWRGQ